MELLGGPPATMVGGALPRRRVKGFAGGGPLLEVATLAALVKMPEIAALVFSGSEDMAVLDGKRLISTPGDLR